MNAFNAVSVEDLNKIQAIFEYLDDDKDGYISYKNMSDFLFDEDVKSVLFNGDSVKLSTESWYYMCDVIYPLDKYLSECPEQKEKEEDLTKNYLQCSHLNPLYRRNGWNIEQLTDAYIKYQFFDLNEHYSLIQSAENSENGSNDDKIYNLMTDLSQNTPSISLIINHGLSTGQHLYVHILNADDDPDKVTWEKLEEIHEKMGTMDVIKRAREKEEILPQDVLYYDPEQCNGAIPATIPDYSVFWHAVFENQLHDLPDYVIHDYFDTIVRPDIEKNNDGMYIEPKNHIERDKMIEEHVFNEMEKYMQPWLWKRYAQLLTNPVYAIST